MRQLLSIALLVCFGLPLVSSLFALAPASEANLPACCRRNGKHHCMMAMAMAERSQVLEAKPGFSAPLEKCPFAPAVLQLSSHPAPLAATPGQTVLFGLLGLAAVLAQTESKRRISRDRSRQKRGPPVLALS